MGGATGGVVSAAPIAVSIAGFSGVDKLISALVGGGGLALAVKDAISMSHDKTSVYDNPMYILWKLRNNL